MIVADTNVVAAFCLASPKSQVARDLWRLDSNWHAPFLWISEFRNVLVLYHRQGIADRQACDEAMALALEAIPASHTYEPPTDHVLDLALSSGCTAYDCEFLAVAEVLNAPLLTWDRELVGVFPQKACEPDSFLTVNGV